MVLHRKILHTEFLYCYFHDVLVEFDDSNGLIK